MLIDCRGSGLSGSGPEHAYFHATKKVKYVTVTDKEAVAAFSFLSRKEGIIPALERACDRICHKDGAQNGQK